MKLPEKLVDLIVDFRNIPYKVRTNFNMCVEYVERVFSYVPILWKCFDFEWDCILIVLKHQLSRLRHSIQYSNCKHTKADADAKKIRICELLCERILKNEYCELLEKHHEEKWGESSILWPDELDDPKGLTGRIIFNRTNIKSNEDKTRESKEIITISRHGDYLKNQDLEYLCLLLSKHLFSWWD